MSRSNRWTVVTQHRERGSTEWRAGLQARGADPDPCPGCV